MTAQPDLRCTDRARLRGDPQRGTAAPGRSWVLVEHPGPWPFRGFAEIDVELAVRQQVAVAARDAGARILLVRRPGRRSDDGPRRWAVLHHDDTGAHRQTWGTWSSGADLRALPEALPAAGDTGGAAALLVCAHGVHDTCCAVRGRPVAAALAGRWPEQTWECSHVGGDRFAANLVVAPDGVYYGGLDAGSAVAVVEDHLAGRITAPYLRGYTTLAPREQAAVVGAIEALGAVGRHELEVLGTEVTDDGGLRVRLRRRGASPQVLAVGLVRERAAPHLLTCRAPEAAAVWTHRVTDVVVEDERGGG